MKNHHPKVLCPRDQWFSTRETLSLRDQWLQLENLVVITAWDEMPLVSGGGGRAGMFLIVLQCPGYPTIQDGPAPNVRDATGV